MEIDLGPEAEQFRDELRAWLAVNRPEGLAADAAEPGGAGGAARWEALRAWTDRLHEAGYMCVSWPREYGGRGLTGVEVAVMNEEFARAGVPRITRGMGEWLVGPSIIVHGTAEQKARFLPRIIDGTDRYCQGFSEPDAGSDLAGLTTRGVVDGEELVVTGQKVWTSGAQLASMMFCLCRTDPEAPKHQGISYVLVPMTRPDGSSNGIDVRPLRQMTGGSGFTETFIHEARAPLTNVIGGLHDGWRVTMTTLGNERGGNATTQHVRYQRQFRRLVDEARERGRNGDPVVRQELARVYTGVELMRIAGLRSLSEIVARREPGPAASVNKMFWSEHARDVSAWAMNLRGAHGMVGPAGDGYPLDRWQTELLMSRSGTIWGGTAEVQRNIVAERVLGLPKEPGAGRDPGRDDEEER